MTPERYNRLRGPGLSVVVMDIVRDAHAKGEELSTRQLTRRVALAAGLTGNDHFTPLYRRVRIVVRDLADAAMLTTTTSFHKVHRVNVTLITLPCSGSTAK